MLTLNTKALLAVLFALALVTAFTVQAADYEGAMAPILYSGKIVAIDPSYKTLTIQAGPNDESFFTVRDNATVTKCDKEVAFNDLKIGDEVKISYFSESLGGNRLVTDIDLGMHC